MLLIPAFVLVCAASLFIIALLRPASRAVAWLLLFLFSYANVVLTGEMASLFVLLHQTWFFLSVHALVALITGWLWWRAGRPSPVTALLPSRADFDAARLLSLAKEQPHLAFTGLAVVLGYLYSALLIVVVPPNNNDALRYHLARVGYWLQHGSMAPWPTVMVQHIYPPVDAQLNFLWLILFTGGDALIGFVQWVSAMSAATGIYGLAALLGWDRRRACFAALIFLCFPSVVLQASSAQIDMVTTALFVAVIYFFIRAIERNERPALFYSALAFGLGFGTKQTFYYLVPVLGIMFVAVLLKYKQQVIKLIALWIVYAVLALVAFAAYSIAINIQAFGNPLGPTETVNYISRINDPAYMLDSLRYNIPRMLYNSLDTSGLPRPIDGYAHKVKAYSAQAFFKLIRYDIEGTRYTFYDFPFKFIDKNQNQEDHAWFGPVSVLLLLPALLWQFSVGVQRRDPYRISLVLMLPVFLLVQSLLWPNWSPYNGRYFAPVVATATALIAGFNWDGKTGRALRWAVVGLSVVIVFVTVLYNPAKQTLGKQAKWVDIWSADRATLLTIQDYGNRDLMLMVQDRVPAETTLGIVQTAAFNQYALFGAGLTRRLIPVYPTDLLTDVNWLAEQNIQYLLVENYSGLPDVPEMFRLIGQVEGWRLYQRK